MATVILALSDNSSKNFPKNETDLGNRLDLIKRGIPNQGNNIDPFVIPAFTLFKDCGLIEHEIIQMLSEKWLCDRVFGEKSFPLGGVLRHQDLSMFDDGGNLRYYSAGKILYVSLEGVRYYISNHWTDKNKQSFFRWLSSKAKQACQKEWTQNRISVAVPPRPPIPVNPTPVNSIQVLIDKIEELEKINLNLCYHIPKLESKIESLEKKIDNLTAMLENIEDFLTKPGKSD